VARVLRTAISGASEGSGDLFEKLYKPLKLRHRKHNCLPAPGHFPAWIGLVPKQNSSGGREKLGSITKQGDRYLRSLFTAGALSVIRYAKIHGTKHRPWLARLLERRPTKVAAIALANKIARMAWAMMARANATGNPSRLPVDGEGTRNEIAPVGAV
jgi:Transposase IS116/IS110/IS902 family